MTDDLAARLREAGCVFAEEEAAHLRASAVAGGVELEPLVVRRLAGEPLETIVGWCAFGRRRLAVGPGVFVPRRRTRFLAGLAVAVLRSRPHGALLEAYAGVAPVAATVLGVLGSREVHVADLDPGALAYARRNAPGAVVHVGDGFEALGTPERLRFGVIAAVPPYVPTSAIARMPREARSHEPGVALVGGEDGLDHVRRLVEGAGPWLARGGVVLVELHRDQAADAAAHAVRAGFVARRHRSADGQTVVLSCRR